MASQAAPNQTIATTADDVSHTPNSLSLVSTVVRNKFVMICCLLALIAMAANIKLIVDFDSGINPKEKGYELSLGEQASDFANLAHFVKGFKTRLFVVFGILVVCLGSILYLFVTRTIVPLHKIAYATGAIAKGNLSVTVPAGTNNDIGELGSAVNELAANFQEIVLLTGTATGNSFAAIEEIEKALNENRLVPNAELEQQVSSLKQDMEMLSSLIENFKFYKARFEGRKVVSYGHKSDSPV
jgi:HAMP domain-containing protein